MLKKALAMLLCALSVFVLLPASPAEARELKGWTTKVDYDNTDPSKYAIEIDVTNQIITVYSRCIGGQVVLRGLCTSGDKEHPTGTGTYKLGNMKERFGYFVNFGQYAQYWTQVVRGIYIHSIMYNSKELSSMSRSAYRKLGTAASHGCVRVLPEVAQWIYYNCPPGTLCKVTRKDKDSALKDAVKDTMPSYEKYVQPRDDRAWPREVPGVIRYDGTPIRTGSSSTNDRTIGHLSAGEKVMLIQLDSEWCKVRTESGRLGYVKSGYILAYPDRETRLISVYASTAKTYVYSKADTGSKKLVTVPEGATVKVESSVNSQWYYGSFNGTEGYLRTKYIKLTNSYAYPELGTGDAGGGGSTGGIGGSGSTDGLGGGSTGGTGSTGGLSGGSTGGTGSTGGLGGGSTGGTGSTGGLGGGSTGGTGSTGGLGGSGEAPVSEPDPAPAPPSGGIVPSDDETGARVKATVTARMRSKPSTSGSIITTLAPGTAVKIISASGAWYRCSANGYEGYIHYSCLDLA